MAGNTKETKWHNRIFTLLSETAKFKGQSYIAFIDVATKVTIRIDLKARRTKAASNLRSDHARAQIIRLLASFTSIVTTNPFVIAVWTVRALVAHAFVIQTQTGSAFETSLFGKTHAIGSKDMQSQLSVHTVGLVQIIQKVSSAIVTHTLPHKIARRLAHKTTTWKLFGTAIEFN